MADSRERLDDLNVLSEHPLVTPAELKRQFPVSDGAMATLRESRAAIRAILERRDPRLWLVIGPCSVHDVAAAMDYAQRLRGLAEEVADSLLLVMRVYFEKPRTTVGWKGLINDPYLDDSFHVEEGLGIARKLLRDLLELGLPTATEALDPVTPQYLQDLISWSAIGARTTESQTHREMASGLSSPVGFKNGTDGGLEVAVNALKSVSTPHRFLGIDPQGQVAVIRTRGNRHAHVVLRGGSAGPNFDAASVRDCEQTLLDAGIAPNIMVDCSHANSMKDPARQPLVMEDVGGQIAAGNQSIVGLMAESNIGFGSQSIPEDKSQLRYGVSVTDGCVNWDMTVAMVRRLREQVGDALARRDAAAVLQAVS